MELGIRGHIFILLLAALFVDAYHGYAQKAKSLYEAKRIYEAPDIDGFIGEEVWDIADVDSVDRQYTPYNDKKCSKKTKFRILYDDKAIYIAALLYDNPDSILSGLGRRDDAFEMNADQFIVEIGPYNDGINSFSFMVSSSGVQSDFKSYLNTKDLNWDAVWKSKTRIIDRGWVVEMKIPHSAIYFSKKPFQVWSLNVYRVIKRKEEISSWNYIDREIEGTTNQAGEMIGISYIKPPLRMSVSPWLCEYLNKETAKPAWDSKLKAGVGLKYGINQSFTLDLSLWPDFGQVQYDDLVLNLSPFETKYPEQRPFFDDCEELFSRADLFYSRRVGFIPEKQDKMSGYLKENEIICNAPRELDISNALRLTGRTIKKMGIGIMNAMSKPGLAILTDTLSGNSRTVENQSFTNYNVLSLDKTLENNSFISFVNTNLIKDNSKYISNISGTEFRFSNREMSYSLSGMAALSQLYDTVNGTELGFKSSLYFDKTSGKFQFKIGNEMISKSYNQNDMGYLPYFNEVSSFSRFNYNIYEPFWYILSLKNQLEIRYSNLFSNGAFSDAKISLLSDIVLNNHYWFNISGFWRPFGNHDYYEAREFGKVFKKVPSYSANIKLQTDSRKVFYLNLYYKYWGNSSSIKMVEHSIGLNPHLRVQSRLQLGFDILLNTFTNSIGFVDSYHDSIFMGQRDIKTISNTVNFIFSFTNKAWINLKVRHYWSKVLYEKYYTLNDNGKLSTFETYPANENQDFEMLNLDCAFKWEFAPGSQISIVWKNMFKNSNKLQSIKYSESLQNMLDSPHYNSLSINFLYYFDFIYLKKNGNSMPHEDLENRE
jgi:hypothetical protein